MQSQQSDCSLMTDLLRDYSDRSEHSLVVELKASFSIRNVRHEQRTNRKMPQTLVTSEAND